MPDDQALAAIAVPVLLVVSADSHDFFARGRRAAQHERLGRSCAALRLTTPAAHGADHGPPQGTRRDDTSAFLREVASRP